MQPSARTIVTAVTTVIVLSASAHAQQRELTADVVKNYFGQVQHDVTELVQRHDMEGIAQWSDRHVADSARFKIFVEMIHDNKPMMWSAIDLDQADIHRLRDLVGAPAVRAIQDYSLRIDVRKVIPHGADAATVMATWSDKAKLKLPEARAAGQPQSTVGQAPQTGTQPRTLDVERRIECDHVLVREQGQLKIGLTSCRARAHF
jgi:hypothetical protein